MLSRSLDVHKQVPLKDVLSFLVLLRDVVCKILLSRSAKAPKQKKRVCQRVKEEEVENSDNERNLTYFQPRVVPHLTQ